MRNSKGVSLIALIITIIVIIILAAIVLSSGGDTTNRAQLAVFTNNFSQYADRVTMDALNVKQTLGIRSENVNDAQLNYMVANGLRTASGDVETTNRTLPVGYILPDTVKKIYKVSGDETVAYIIDDKNITGYGAQANNPNGSAGYEFYGDTNGQEYHFITSDGHVFTLPGFALSVEDGTVQYYISNEKGAYYVVKGKSTLSKGDLNQNGDKVDEELPINPVTVMKGHKHGRTASNTVVTAFNNSTTDPLPNQSTTLKKLVGTEPGRYTSIDQEDKQ